MADDKDAEKQTFFGSKVKEEDLNVWEQYEQSLRDGLYHVQPHAVPLLAVYVIVSVGWLVGYTWAFVAYNKHKIDGCSKPLLAWLVVEGITGYINIIFALAVGGYAFNLVTSTGAERLRTMATLPRAFVGLITTFFIWCLWHLAWFIVGTAWVFQLGRHEPPCHQPLYDFCWWFLTIGWAWYILSSIVGCIMSACLPPPKKVAMKVRSASGSSDRPNSAAALAASSSSASSSSPAPAGL